MFVDIKKLFDAAYKKNKILTCVVCYLAIVSLTSLAGSAFFKMKTRVRINSDTLLTHSTDITHIKKSIDEYDTLSHSVVTRQSFNSYIKRKDTEYHTQNEFNNTTASKVGNLEGEIFILSSLFNNYVTKEGVDNE